MRSAETVIIGSLRRRVGDRRAHDRAQRPRGAPPRSGRRLPLADDLLNDLGDGTRNSTKLHDWGYKHRVNSVAALRFPLPRGRVVGGSSAVNTCIALRGVPSDFDEWAALGLDDWTWARCLPAFKRLEGDLDRRDEWHGADGPFPIDATRATKPVPWQAAFLDACERMGLPRTDDLNHPEADGRERAPDEQDRRRAHGRRALLPHARGPREAQPAHPVRRARAEGDGPRGPRDGRRVRVARRGAHGGREARGAAAAPSRRPVSSCDRASVRRRASRPSA